MIAENRTRENRQFSAILLFACNLIWWAVWVSRWHETAGNKQKRGEKDKDIERKEAENTRKTATILWLSLGATIKLGIFSDVCLSGPTK